MNLRLLWILWNGIRQHSNLPKETGVAKRRETSGFPHVWIAELVCARYSLDRDLSRNSRNKMMAHITCRIGR